MVGNLQVHLNGKIIATPKLLLYSQTSPNCKTPPSCAQTKFVFSILWCYWQLQKTHSGAILATTDEQTSDSLHTFRWEIFIKP
jgi:hypothetical protein